MRKDEKHGVVPPGTDLPAVSKIREVTIGGCWDTVLRKFVGPCKNPRVWLVGNKQFDILTGKPGTRHSLLYSAEGAGKTMLMAMWCWAQVFIAATLGVTGNLGATAPTGARLGTLIQAVSDLAPVGAPREHRPNEWGILYADSSDLRTITGHTIQFRSTKQQSGAIGSPIQGWNWGLGAACDELQDSIHAYEDIVARLRAGKDAPIMGTATAKDSPAWRTFRDSLSENWTIHRLSYTDTPFVHDSHWEMMQQECSPREWKRRGLALDVGPERMVYVTWDREKNLQRIPHGAMDVTAEVLARWGSSLTLLAGHDPGKLCDVTLLFKCYRLPGVSRPVWFVVDEITTYETTTQQHVTVLLKRLRDKWKCNDLDWRGNPSEFGAKVLVRADPYSDSGRDENAPDRSVYTIFRNAGIKILPAAMTASIDKVKVAKIPKEAGINMICSLFCNVRNENRLRVAANDNGEPVAEKFVESVELSERDGDGKAEAQKKNRKDLSHWTATARYALWDLEKPRFQEAAA